MYGWFKGTLNWAPMMPRDASLSDSECEIFQPGYYGNWRPAEKSPKIHGVLTPCFSTSYPVYLLGRTDTEQHCHAILACNGCRANLVRHDGYPSWLDIA